MSLLESIISGILQGITEFLPVSSSGHLVLLHNLFGIKEMSMMFDVFLHLATLLAVVIFFFNDICEIFRGKNYKFLLFIFIATLPAVIAGFFLEDFIESFFYSTQRVGYMFFITAILLLAAVIKMKNTSENKVKIGPVNSIVIGIAQAMAIIPGISRSGATISAGLLSGISKKDAFNFSFIMSIPIILGAVLYEVVKSGFSSFAEGGINILATGMLAAFFSGIICLRLLWWVVRTDRLYLFSIYLFLLGFITIYH